MAGIKTKYLKNNRIVSFRLRKVFNRGTHSPYHILDRYAIGERWPLTGVIGIL